MAITQMEELESDKRYGLKMVEKPCDGKPHARFDDGMLGMPQNCTSILLYKLLQVIISAEILK